MNRFAALLDRLAFEAGRNAKLALITDYLRTTPDPERGYAIAAMTGALSFSEAKPAAIRKLISERTDPVLFALSYDYVGDLSETVALMWPDPTFLSPSPSGGGLEFNHSTQNPHPELVEGSVIFKHRASTPPFDRLRVRPRERLVAICDSLPLQSEVEAGEGQGHNQPPLHLSDVAATLSTISRRELPAQLAIWLDGLDATGRWALLKLITGGLRVGVSARLAKTAIAMLGAHSADDIEEVWHGMVPPYVALLAWAEGRGERPVMDDQAPFRPPMLAHPIEDRDFETLDPKDFAAEWKWDGIRVQAAAGMKDGEPITRLFTRTGDEISGGFPDLAETLTGLAGANIAFDGELLVMIDGAVQSFNALQQRLNRKQVSARMLADHPAHLRIYDVLAADGEDLRAIPFRQRRTRLEELVDQLGLPRLDISPLVPFSNWDELARMRADPSQALGGGDAQAVEGCMLKRWDSAYLPGRPRGPWFKWKRDPHLVDCVLMYAQRGHGKRSSFYSDFTFGLWKETAAGMALLPVGKAYFGFTDSELVDLDRHVRKHTTNRFGPVREVAHGRHDGLVLEIAFDGLQRSTRHKSGIAMRFPRISRIRHDKPAAEADRLETLERLLNGAEATDTETMTSNKETPA